MPRHTHKPRHDKDVVTQLQEMKEAKEQTQAIKSDLIEHNNVIKIHGDMNDTAGDSANEANEQEQMAPKAQAPAQPIKQANNALKQIDFSNNDKAKSHRNEERHEASEDSTASNAVLPVSSGMDLSALSAPFEQIFSFQAQMIEMQVSAWKSFMGMLMTRNFDGFTSQK